MSKQMSTPVQTHSKRIKQIKKHIQQHIKRRLPNCSASDSGLFLSVGGGLRERARDSLRWPDMAAQIHTVSHSNLDNKAIWKMAAHNCNMLEDVGSCWSMSWYVMVPYGASRYLMILSHHNLYIYSHIILPSSTKLQ